MKQSPLALEVLCHFDAETCFKVQFPLRIIGIRFTPDFDVPLNRHLCGSKQLYGLRFPSLTQPFTAEDPMAFIDAVEVLVFHPSPCFFRVSPFRPLPECQEDSVIHRNKGRLTDHMAVVVCPASNHRIELGNQLPCCGLGVTFDDRSDVSQECLDILGGGLNQQLPLVLAEMLSQKIKAVTNGGDFGFLG